MPGPAAVIATEDGPFPTPHAYTLGPGEAFKPTTVFAIFDGSAAAGAFLPCCTFYSQDGKILGRTFPSTVPAGDIAEVTFSPFGLPPVSAGGCPCGANPRTEGAADWWGLGDYTGDASTAKDSGPGAHNGTYQHSLADIAVSAAAGIYPRSDYADAKCFSYDAVDPAIFPGTPTKAMGAVDAALPVRFGDSGAFTMAVWVQTNGDGYYYQAYHGDGTPAGPKLLGGILGQRKPGAGQAGAGGVYIYLDTNDLLPVLEAGVAGNYARVKSGRGIDTLSMLAAVYDAGTVLLYHNGALQGSALIPAGVLAGIDRIGFGGVDFTLAVGGYWAPGHVRVDEGSLYRGALTGAELAALYGGVGA